MLFSSPQFIFLFLPTTLAVFALIPAEARRWRKAWLCAASLFFYGYWRVEYVPLLVGSILFNFGIATRIVGGAGRVSARRWLACGIVGNLLALGYFKYTNFIVSILGLSIHRDLGRFDIILPLAISFFTFTQIAYLVDVLRNPAVHCTFLDYALFVVFFPHLIAGPILRHWEVVPQWAKRALRIQPLDVSVGFSFFLMGLCKKLVLADPIASYADALYGAAARGATVNFLDAWIGTTAFALQIYFDFSGYSDMAVGLARMFGIKFPFNFDSPYQAASASEFWRRWHQTLMRFLREYVYIPLGGNRVGPLRRWRNVLVTFFLSGLWHGAGWTFIVWGLLQFLYVSVAQEYGKFIEARGWRPRHWSYRGLCVLLTFAAVVISWSYFRAPDLPTANRVASAMIGRDGFTVSDGIARDTLKGRVLSRAGARFVAGEKVVGDYRVAMLWLCGLLGIVWLAPNTGQLLQSYESGEAVSRPTRWRLKLEPKLGLVMGIVLFLVVHTQFQAAPSPFLYFNF